MALLHAWTADDAYISFRVIEQMVHGNGAVFNPGERVQVFTHPLWLGMLAAIRLSGTQPAAVHLWLSLALFGGGVWYLLWSFRQQTVPLVLAALALAFSRAIVDFATSGLETSLSFFLFALTVYSIKRDRWRTAAACIALLPLNRPDLVPLVLPFAFLVYLARRRWTTLAAMAAPTILWLLFSAVYYGSALPNTAYAKLGLPLSVRVDQGLAYVASSLLTDPGALTLFVGAFAGISSMRGRADRDGNLARACAAAALLSLLACVWEGGDFMLGRFLLPFLWTAAAVMLASLNAHTAIHLGFMLALMQLVTGQSTAALYLDGGVNEKGASYYGAIDERRFWVRWMGLFAARPVSEISTSFAARTEPYRVGPLGLTGYRSAPGAKLVDAYGLSDPLLARVSPVAGRAGHLYRPFPGAFWKWRDPEYRFSDPAVQAVAADIRLAHASPELFTVARAGAIARLAVARLPQHALRVDEKGAAVDIRLEPQQLYRLDYGDGDYLVKIRLDDPLVRRADGVPPSIEKYPVAVSDARCTLRPAGDGAGTVSIQVREGSALGIECPASLVRRGLVMAIGRTGPQGPRFDESMTLRRPAFTWIASAPQWLVSGWSGRPGPAVASGLLLAMLWLAVSRFAGVRSVPRYPPR